MEEEKEEEEEDEEENAKVGAFRLAPNGRNSDGIVLKSEYCQCY